MVAGKIDIVYLALFRKLFTYIVPDLWLPGGSFFYARSDKAGLQGGK